MSKQAYPRRGPDERERARFDLRFLVHTIVPGKQS
jgi:hypothetical protein